jgi:hypothetical protein
MWAKDDERGRGRFFDSRLFAWRRGVDSDEYPDDGGQLDDDGENDVGSLPTTQRDGSTNLAADHKKRNSKGDQSSDILGQSTSKSSSDVNTREPEAVNTAVREHASVVCAEALAQAASVMDEMKSCPTSQVSVVRSGLNRTKEM